MDEQTPYRVDPDQLNDFEPFMAKLGPGAAKILVHRIALVLRENSYRYLRTLKLLLRNDAIISAEDVRIFESLVWPGGGEADLAVLSVLEPVFRNVLPELKKRKIVSNATEFISTGARDLCRKLIHFSGYTINHFLFFRIFFSWLEDDPARAPSLVRLLELVNGRLELNGYSTAAFYKDLTNRTYRVLDYQKRPEARHGLLKMANTILKYLRFEGRGVYPNPELLRRCLEENWDTKTALSALPRLDPELFERAVLYSRTRLEIDYRYLVLSPQFTFLTYSQKLTPGMLPAKRLDNFTEIMRWNALETLRVERFLRLLTKASERPVLVISNLRLGKMYTAALERAMTDRASLRFLDARIGSTELTNRIFITDNHLDLSTTRYLLESRPHVVVVDASIQGRFPYAFKGYTNLFAAVNDVLAGQPGFSNFRYCCHHPKEIEIDNVANYRKEPSYVSTVARLARIRASGRYAGAGEPYRLFLLSHPSLSNVVLRAGYDETEPMLMNHGTNSTDIATDNYYPNLVTDRFFSTPGAAGEMPGSTPGLFLLNAFFPFDLFYRGREDERLPGIGASLRELGIGPALNTVSSVEDRQGAVSFDDLCEVLLDTTTGITGALHVDTQTGTVKLVNDNLINRIAEHYLEFKEKYGIRMDSPVK